MKKNNKYILIILTIVMLLVIFAFSNMNSDKSNGGSKGILKNSVIIVDKVFHKNMTDKEINRVVNKLNYPFRKICHFSEYFILALLILLLLRSYNIKLMKCISLTILICFFISVGDEIHQMFNDRTSLFTDCLIDTLGSIVCCFIYYLRTKKRIS